MELALYGFYKQFFPYIEVNFKQITDHMYSNKLEAGSIPIIYNRHLHEVKSVKLTKSECQPHGAAIEFIFHYLWSINSM